MEGGFFLWGVEFFKIGKCDFMFIIEMRVGRQEANLSKPGYGKFLVKSGIFQF